MNILLLKMCLIGTIMLSGYHHPDGKTGATAKHKKIVVTGRAGNAMGGAVVTGNDHITYYLDGKAFWDKKLNGKKIKVSGTLVVKHNATVDSQGRPLQAIANQKIIMNPKWELVMQR